jgi:exosortase A
MKRDALPIDVGLPLAESSAAAWRTALLALAVSMLFVVGAYASTAADIVGIWYRSSTFVHGFAVVPIVAWLIWRKRAELSRLEPRPWPHVLPISAAIGVTWLVGEFGSVNALSQGAFVAMLVVAVVTVLGREVARAIIFPLAFLAFAVPVGDFLLPTLMDRTADFTVFALRATGVPVYREGLMMVLPTGTWSVVEACSGVRYLIASLMTGTLFAYLTYSANWRRWVFVGAAAVVPIVANWLRAYLIVLLGHLSNNRLAAGVDHLIYGWLFFGFVMLLMFWIGASWREPESTTAGAAVSLPSPRAAGSRNEFWTAAIAIITIALVWPLIEWATRVPARESAPVLAIDAIADWSPIDDRSGFTPHFSAPSALLRRSWVREGAIAGLQVAYYRQQTQERKVVSSENVLVQAEERTWTRTRRNHRVVAFGNAPHEVFETQLRGPDGRNYVVWQWYWIEGDLTARDPVAKARIAWSRLLHQTDDSASIIVFAADTKSHSAVDTLQAFTRAAWPVIDAALHRAASP